MSLIKFRINKGYLYFIFYWLIDLFDLLEKYIFEYEDKKPKKEKYTKEFSIINLLSQNLSDLLAGFLVLYTYRKISSIENEGKEEKKLVINKNAYELIYNDLSIKRNKHKLIFLISILHFIVHLSYLLFFFIMFDKIQPDRHDMDWLITIEILMFILFNKIILKRKYYKHHMLGLIFNSIGFINIAIINIYKINYENDKPFETWIFLLFSLPKFVLFPLEDAINKILLMNKFMLPHTLMFCRGICEFIFNFILCIILFLATNIKFTHFKIILSDIHKIFLLLLSTIFQFLRNFIIMKIIYIFTPTHVSFVAIADIFIDVIYKVFVIRVHSFNFIMCILFLSAFIIIFGALIFNEMIIINAYNLEEGTQEGLLNKEKLDSLDNNELIINESIINNENDDEEEDNINDNINN